MLQAIFPRFDSAFEGIEHYETQEWRSNLRACSEEKLPVYFGLAVPTDDIGRRELDQLVSLSGDAGNFAGALLDLASQKRRDGRTRVWQALEQLSDSEASIFPQENLPSAIKGLVDAGDELVRVEDPTGFLARTNNKERLDTLISLLLERLEASQRYTLLQDIVKTGKGLSTVVSIVEGWGADHGKYNLKSVPEDQRLLDSDKVTVLEQAAAKRIADAAEAGGLPGTPNLVYVLYRWKDWSGPNPLTDWLASYLQEDENFLLFLKELIPDDQIGMGRDPISKLKSLGWLKSVQHLIKIEDYSDHIERLNRRHDLTERDKIRLKLLCS